MLSIKAERSWIPSEGDEVLIAERPQGTFTRRLFLSEGLDSEKISAQYEQGVLTVTVPVAAVGQEPKDRRSASAATDEDKVLEVTASLRADPRALRRPDKAATTSTPLGGRREILPRVAGL